MVEKLSLADLMTTTAILFDTMKCFRRRISCIELMQTTQLLAANEIVDLIQDRG